MRFPDCKLIDCEQRSDGERMITKRSELLHSDLLRMLNYNPNSGHFTWINPPKNHPRMKNKEAGTSGNGYIEISIYRLKFKAHRLAWFYVYGTWCDVIDHINRNPFDNRICNLRSCSHSENMRNHSRVGNSSGLPTGVRINKSSGRYAARIRYNRKLITIGTFDSPSEAELAYKQTRKELFKEFSPL